MVIFNSYVKLPEGTPNQKLSNAIQQSYPSIVSNHVIQIAELA